MNAAELIRTAPLGAVVAFSDGTPRPPERFTKKLAAWKLNNGQGVLTAKTAASVYATTLHPYRASFTLREGEYGTASTICLIVNRVHDEASALDYVVIEQPCGPVRVDASGALVSASQIAERLRKGYADPQPGETEHPAGYGAGQPSPVRPGATVAAEYPGVTLWAPYTTATDRIAVRAQDGAHVLFPGTFGAALTARLDALSDDAARGEVLRGLMAVRLDQGQKIAPGSLGLSE